MIKINNPSYLNKVKRDLFYVKKYFINMDVKVLLS